MRGTGTADLQNLNVLLVDDAEEWNALLKRALEQRGAQVDVAQNGLVGVTAAIRQHYDVILMDVHMPVLNGVDAATHLRECGYKGLIVACTGHDPTEINEGDLNGAGFDDFFAKPLDFASLFRRLRRFYLLKTVQKISDMH